MTATQQIPPDVQQQLTMLRDYCRTLQSQNNSRNEERKILEKEIQRLAKVQKQREKGGSTKKQCEECRKYKSQVIRLQNTVERLQKENNNLQESYNFVSGSLTQRTQRIERVEVRQVDGSNITLGAGGSVGNVAIKQLEDKIKDLQKKNSDHINKYKDLSQRYDAINSQNLNLKLKLQNITKSTNNSLQSQISSLTSQKHNLSIQLSSLQQQLHKIKSSLSQKQQEIFNIKNKQSLQSSTNQLELKVLKDSVVGKDKEVAILRDKLKLLGDHQFQIRGLKADLQNKNQQIDILKQDINRCEDEINKVYKLQTDIRNLKYQLTERDTQIQKLKKKSSQLSSSQLQKLSTLESTISTLTSTLSSKQSQLKNLRQQNHQIPSLLSQISKYQTQVQTLKSQMIDLQSKPVNQINSNPLSETLTHYTGQIADLNIDVGRLRGQIREKEEYIRRVEDQLREMMRRDEEKNLEVKKLDKIVNSYVQKIGQLQIQLNRIQKASSIQQPPPASVQLNQTFNPTPQLQLLTNENQALNLKIQSLEHRIAILQQTNRNLREQLRLSIELRNRDREASRISMVPVQSLGMPVANGEMEELLATIRMLKGEVDEMRTINNKAKLDNQYLQAKLSAAEIQIDGLIGFGKGIQIGRIREQAQVPKRDFGIVATNKILANMPMVETSKMYQPNPLPKSPSSNFRPKQHAYTVLDDNQRDPMSSTTPIKTRTSEPLFSSTAPVPYRSSLKDRPMVQTSKLSSTSSMIPVSNISSGVNDSKLRRRQESGRQKADVGELQKRIEMLKQENKGLRKHLYDGGA